MVNLFIAHLSGGTFRSFWPTLLQASYRAAAKPHNPPQSSRRPACLTDVSLRLRGYNTTDKQFRFASSRRGRHTDDRASVRLEFQPSESRLDDHCDHLS